MSLIVSIIQSNYIPWKGYFDLINMSDVFVIYDDMQYTKRDWRKRNQIKSPSGLVWLTIPIKTSKLFGQRISEARISNSRWAAKHWKTIQQNYSKARYFKAYENILENTYDVLGEESLLSKINLRMITLVCRFLGIDTTITSSDTYAAQGDPTEKLVDI